MRWFDEFDAWWMKVLDELAEVGCDLTEEEDEDAPYRPSWMDPDT